MTALILCVACATDDDPGGTSELHFDFADGTYMGFEVDMSDFTPGTEGDLQHEVTAMPDPLDGVGVRVFAYNYSDDLWHFLWRELGPADGIVPGQTYDVSMRLEVASNVATGCVGVGGAPSGVYLKGGVAGRLPERVFDDEIMEFVFSIDKGNQAQIGPEAIDLGTIETPGDDCIGEGPWYLLDRMGSMTQPVTATDEGKLWVWIGGDSGYESFTILYYDRISVTLSPR